MTCLLYINNFKILIIYQMATLLNRRSLSTLDNITPDNITPDNTMPDLSGLPAGS